MITALISGKNLLHNISTLQNLAPNSKLMVMVKANAYGHGIYEVSNYLEKNLDKKLFALGVARIDEAILLRNKGIKVPILLAEGVFERDDLLIAAKENFLVIFHNSQQLNWLENANLPNQINVWLKINTGMNRLGFSLNEAKNAYEVLLNNQNIIKPIVVASHFACADDLKNQLNNLQINEFQKFTNNLPILKSLNNSAAIFNFPQTNFDIIRAGISIYGASPVQDKTADQLNLKPVMTLQSKIIAIHNLQAGETVGYGARFKCQENTKIAIIAAGYGDGYSRTIQDGAPVLINNIKCQIAGRISMDMISVNLKNCPNAKIGDSVILWGEDLPVEEVAKFSSCISYDLFCGVQKRVKYVWKD
jgi:alanine racemase